MEVRGALRERLGGIAKVRFEDGPLPLRELADPVRLSIIRAPFDDELESEEERAEVEAARGESGPGTPHEDVLREFGS